MMNSSFFESVLSELTAAIVFAALGLLFARPIAFEFKRRIYRSYLLPSQAVPSIIVHDETPLGGSNARMLTIQNDGNLALTDFRLYKCSFTLGTNPSLQIEPLDCVIENIIMDSERGCLAGVRGLPFNVFQFGNTFAENRFYVEMSDADGHIFRLTNYVTSDERLYPQGLHVVRRHLPRKVVKKCGDRGIARFKRKYSLDMVVG